MYSSLVSFSDGFFSQGDMRIRVFNYYRPFPNTIERHPKILASVSLIMLISVHNYQHVYTHTHKNECHLAI